LYIIKKKDKKKKEREKKKEKELGEKRGISLTI